MHTIIARAPSQITIGEPKAIDALTMIPLIGGADVEQLPAASRWTIRSPAPGPR